MLSLSHTNVGLHVGAKAHCSSIAMPYIKTPRPREVPLVLGIVEAVTDAAPQGRGIRQASSASGRQTDMEHPLTSIVNRQYFLPKGIAGR